MKTLIRILVLVLSCVMVLSVLASCGETPDSGTTPVETKSPGTPGTPGKTPVETESQTPKVSITFANTGLPVKTVEKGSTVSRPADPTKEGAIFGGWFKDASFTTEMEFPVKADTDLTIYAQFFDYREAYKEARKNTIGDSVPGFGYQYTLKATASYNGLSLNGNQNGTARYSKTGDVNFYDEHTNSGSLFYDGSKYQILRNTTLQKVALDEKGSIDSYSVEEVGADYKYDSSSFAKAVFTYSDDQLKSISPTSEKNVYKLKTSLNASSVIALIGNNINNPIVAKTIGELPETSVSTGMYVTFSNGKIATYKYEITINVTNLQFSLVYTLTFTDSGEAKTIVPRTFEGISITEADIKKDLAAATTVVDAFRAKAQSGYDFDVQTGVDFGATSGEINAKFKGSAMRKVDGGQVYFHNDIEIDSDYKNADLYKSAGISDVHVKLTRLANGEVHIIEKKVLADSTKQITDFTPSDNTSYYLFDVLSNAGCFSFAQINTKDGITTHTFGLTNEGAAKLLNWLSANMDLDPLDKATTDVKIYGNLNASSLLVKKGTVSVQTQGSTLISIQVSLKAEGTTSFAGSSKFTAAESAQIKLDFKLTPNTAGNSFTPYETVKAAK